MPWITLKVAKQIRRGGVARMYYPGDSVEVGRQTALDWVLNDLAEDPFGQVGTPLLESELVERGHEYGVRVRSEKGNAEVTPLGQVAQQLSYGEPAIPYKYTLIWRPGVRVNPKMARYGFLRILETDREVGTSWEMAASLVSLSVLADSVGSEEDQAKTLKLVGDLRLPVYESRLVWARNCPSAQKVVAAWAAELEDGAGEYHAFLRALYSNRTLLCTIPSSWQG